MTTNGKKRIGLLTQEAAGLLKRAFEREARPYRLTLLQWRILGALGERDGQTQTELGQELRTGAMTISDVVERLEGMALVRREVDPGDSRAKRVHLTEKGAALRRRMRDKAERVYGQALDGLTPAEIAATEEVLRRISDNLLGQTGPAPRSGRRPGGEG
ncbi:MarR family transcriptional regulator [Pseudooceanicola sp. CBS1P-1]|uniref:MarR family transcriptional regulator n=1 Tax=Pseudooceanicola albus TaxID=2692189 RepID=A0A6L7FZ87_9RHOB|nr:MULTISPECIES: MarR family transcriptional regulator [Pseudooceanicola]MBT9382438.1 MarR family transcriptional regulator [Pseudooceanicola endophyticus]MXN16979.1 MarR family transcriptional regulator [Pseudooceanicola albus]